MLARAICQDTDILLLDEPTSYLDMGFKLDILANIRMLARDRNLAIIMSLHELDLAQKVSDTIACVKGDHIDRIGTPEEIFAGTYVQELYGVSDTSFDPVTGEVFLNPSRGTPEVLVAAEVVWQRIMPYSVSKLRFLPVFCRKMIWNIRLPVHWRRKLFFRRHFIRWKNPRSQMQKNGSISVNRVFVHWIRKNLAH